MPEEAAEESVVVEVEALVSKGENVTMKEEDGKWEGKVEVMVVSRF